VWDARSAAEVLLGVAARYGLDEGEVVEALYDGPAPVFASLSGWQGVDEHVSSPGNGMRTTRNETAHDGFRGRSVEVEIVGIERSRPLGGTSEGTKCQRDLAMSGWARLARN
jgi:hypothetical protein